MVAIDHWNVLSRVGMAIRRAVWGRNRADFLRWVLDQACRDRIDEVVIDAAKHCEPRRTQLLVRFSARLHGSDVRRHEEIYLSGPPRLVGGCSGSGKASNGLGRSTGEVLFRLRQLAVDLEQRGVRTTLHSLAAEPYINRPRPRLAPWCRGPRFRRALSQGRSRTV